MKYFLNIVVHISYIIVLFQERCWMLDARVWSGVWRLEVFADLNYGYISLQCIMECIVSRVHYEFLTLSNDSHTSTPCGTILKYHFIQYVVHLFYRLYRQTDEEINTSCCSLTIQPKPNQTKCPPPHKVLCVWGGTVYFLATTT